MARHRTIFSRRQPGILLQLRCWLLRTCLLCVALFLLAVSVFAVLDPPTNVYMWSESRRLNGIRQDWAALEDIAPVMARSAVAAEDANFCQHWGFDMRAIRAVMAEGSARGASTITQQVVKNVYLWQKRSWSRKALESVITPVVELIWTKRRIVEVYLNIAEFDEGVFGVRAAALHYFNTAAADLTPPQAAHLAAVLPDPKGRSASAPSAAVMRRAAAIQDGAATIQADGRAKCFDKRDGN